MYYKNIDGQYVESISTGCGQASISEFEYNAILSIIHSAPVAPEGYVYKLRDGSLTWELVELPPMPEPDPDPELTDEEALAIILGGGEA